VRLALVVLAFLMVVTGCTSEPETRTCESSHLLTPGDDVDVQDLWHGTYVSTWNTEDVASACFADGRSLGVAEMACALIEEIDGEDSGYTLMFTYDGGDTYPVLASLGGFEPPTPSLRRMPSNRCYQGKRRAFTVWWGSRGASHVRRGET
jgi:hypothetical protein